jgi:hypothetical protein
MVLSKVEGLMVLSNIEGLMVTARQAHPPLNLRGGKDCLKESSIGYKTSGDPTSILP